MGSLSPPSCREGHRGLGRWGLDEPELVLRVVLEAKDLELVLPGEGGAADLLLVFDHDGLDHGDIARLGVLEDGLVDLDIREVLLISRHVTLFRNSRHVTPRSIVCNGKCARFMILRIYAISEVVEAS